MLASVAARPALRTDAARALIAIRALHDRDHDCHDGGWIRPRPDDDYGQWPPPEWPCPTLGLVNAALAQAQPEPRTRP